MVPHDSPTDEVAPPTARLWLELADTGTDDADDAESDAESDEDTADTVYRFDLTWLTSSWTCIFGAGCPGIDSAVPDAGCCVHGAGAAWAEADEDGDRRTARVAGACVFHNPRGFPGGYGCALHALALAEGVPPLQTKPDVCWQLPLRRTYDTVERPDGSEYLQVTVTEYTRAGWGGGGADFDWYCSGSPSAHVGAEPVWLSLRDELVELVGTAVYEQLAEHCAQLAPQASRPGSGGRVLLPLTVHPATAAAHGRTGATRIE